ncbi:Unknown protein, partial [Striga hermonthica]
VAHFLPVSMKMSLDKLAEIYTRGIIRLHGVPITIVSDRDPRFVSRFWHSLHEAMGTKLEFSSAYHPETDGQSERTIQTLEDMLRALVVDRGAKWESFLPYAEFASSVAAGSQPSPADRNPSRRTLSRISQARRQLPAASASDAREVSAAPARRRSAVCSHARPRSVTIRRPRISSAPAQCARQSARVQDSVSSTPACVQPASASPRPHRSAAPRARTRPAFTIRCQLPVPASATRTNVPVSDQHPTRTTPAISPLPPDDRDPCTACARAFARNRAPFTSSVFLARVHPAAPHSYACEVSVAARVAFTRAPSSPATRCRAYLPSPAIRSPTVHPSTPNADRVLTTRSRASPPDARLSPVRPSITPDQSSASTTTSLSLTAGALLPL